jgi:hypothetical protein
MSSLSQAAGPNLMHQADLAAMAIDLVSRRGGRARGAGVTCGGRRSGAHEGGAAVQVDVVKKPSIGHPLIAVPLSTRRLQVPVHDFSSHSS